jgi:protein-S-isoprenylcysteine O-methyltransferase Ste14
VPASAVTACALLVSVRDFARAVSRGNALNRLNMVGLGITMLGVVIRRLAKRALGKRYTNRLRIVERHRLARHRIYRRVRHPGYLGTLIADIALPLIFSSPRGSLVMLLLIPCFVYRTGVEEKMLIQEFGGEYLRYMKSTWRLIPHIY